MAFTLIGNNEIQVNISIHLRVPTMILEINFWQSPLKMSANLVLYFFILDVHLSLSVRLVRLNDDSVFTSLEDG